MYRFKATDSAWYESEIKFRGYPTDDWQRIRAMHHSGADLLLSSVPDTLYKYITVPSVDGGRLIPLSADNIYLGDWRSNIVLTEEKLPYSRMFYNLGCSSQLGGLLRKYLNPQSEQTKHLGERRVTFVDSQEMMCENCAAIEECWKADGDWLCADCLKELGYVQCEACGAWVKEDDAREGADGMPYCDDCFYERFFICEDCGDACSEDDVFWVHGRYGDFAVCGSCIDDYYECMDCHEYFTEDLTYSDNDGNRLCHDCYDSNWHTCEDCGVFISDDDTYWDDDDNCYCASCYEESHGREHNYSYKPCPCFHKTPQDFGELFFGVEDEVDNGEDKCDCLAEVNRIADEDSLYCKHDGSLNDGFEMVSHPMTLRYHMTKMPWKDVFEKVLHYGFRSHDTSTCGLHIHVGREGLGADLETQEESVRKIIFLVDRHWDKILTFTRRKESRIDQWARRPALDWIDEDTSIDDIRDGIDPWRCNTRYTAVNCCNGKTIEFRIYRGTLNHTSFLAALQFTSNICKYAMTHTWQDCRVSTWADIACFEAYDELSAYLDKRGLAPQSIAEPDEDISYDTEDIAVVAIA